MNTRWISAWVFILAVAVAGAWPADAQAQRLGRLFTSADERAALDEARQQAAMVQPAPQPEPQPEPAQAPAVQAAQPAGPSISRLVINGVVRRSGGSSTVWVNGDRVDRGSISREGVAVESAHGTAGSIRLRLPSGAGTVALRPGQQIDIDSGTLLEAYEKQPEGARDSVFQPAAARERRATDGAGDEDAREPLEAPPTPGPSTSGGAAAPPDSQSALVDRLREISDLPPTEQARALEQMQAAPADAPPQAPSR